MQFNTVFKNVEQFNLFKCHVFTRMFIAQNSMILNVWMLYFRAI